MLEKDFFPKFWNLSRRLIQHNETSDSFFSSTLLHAISETLGYKSLTISKYVGSKFCGIITYVSADLPVFERYNEEYYTFFRPNDPFAKVLTKYSNLVKTAPPVILSSEALDFSEKEIYNKHLQKWGLGWSAGIPFGTYRLVINKSLEEGDFTPSEVTLLKYVGELLYSKSLDFDRCMESRTYFNSLRVGKLMFADTGDILDCNDYALSFLMKAFSIQQVSEIPALIKKLFNETNVDNIDPFAPCQRLIHGHMFMISNYISRDGFGQINKTWNVLITLPNINAKNNALSSFKEIYKLSNRENDVVALLAEGNSLNEISENMHISLGTVRSHLKNIFTKTGVNNQKLLIKKYYQGSLQ